MKTEAQQLSAEFTRVMIEWLAPDELDSIRKRKSDPSHWCDDNMIMVEAWESLWPNKPCLPSDIEDKGTAQGKLRKEIEAEHEAACTLWSDAANILQESNYFVGGE